MAEESIFPFLQPTAAAPAAELPVLRECAWDFVNDIPILRHDDRRGGRPAHGWLCHPKCVR